MESVNIHEAKTHFSKLLEKLSSGEANEIIIAKAGKPVAKLVPYQATPAKRQLGLLANQGDYWESPDCWEPDHDLIDLMINGPLFPDEAPQEEHSEKSVAEDHQDYQA